MKTNQTIPNAKRKRRTRTAAVLIYGACFFALGLVVGAVFAPKAQETTAETAQTAAEVYASAEAAKYRVALDAGHGGYNANAGSEDMGCTGSGYWEADVTYEIVQQLTGLLIEDGRFEVIPTTDGETYAAPSMRGAAAKAAGAELLLSVHCDTDSDSTVRGFTCYPAVPCQDTNADSLRFAHCLTEEMAALGEPLRGENGIRYLYFVGEDSERQICESSDSAPKEYATYTILETCGCPAVLAEICFLSNAEDAALLTGEEGTQRAASACYHAVCRYFEERNKSEEK